MNLYNDNNLDRIIIIVNHMFAHFTVNMDNIIVNRFTVWGSVRYRF